MIRDLRRDARTAGVALLIVLVAAVTVVAILNSRLVAPPPLTGTVDSPEALARAVLDGLRAGDRARLEDLALTEEEFRAYIWPELPVSEARNNFPFEFVWRQLNDRSQLYLDQLVAGVEARGAPQYEVLGVEFAGEVTDYDGVTVYRETEVLVRTTDGNEETVRAFGSTIEQDGRYKVFSYVVD